MVEVISTLEDALLSNPELKDYTYPLGLWLPLDLGARITVLQETYGHIKKCVSQEDVRLHEQIECFTQKLFCTLESIKKITRIRAMLRT